MMFDDELRSLNFNKNQKKNNKNLSSRLADNNVLLILSAFLPRFFQWILYISCLILFLFLFPNSMRNEINFLEPINHIKYWYNAIKPRRFVTSRQ